MLQYLITGIGLKQYLSPTHHPQYTSPMHRFDPTCPIIIIIQKPFNDLFAWTPKHLYITGVCLSPNIVFECPLASETRWEDRIWSRESYRFCIPFFGIELIVDCLGINVNGRHPSTAGRERPTRWDDGIVGANKSLCTSRGCHEVIFACTK